MIIPSHNLCATNATYLQHNCNIWNQVVSHFLNNFANFHQKRTQPGSLLLQAWSLMLQKSERKLLLLVKMKQTASKEHKTWNDATRGEETREWKPAWFFLAAAAAGKSILCKCAFMFPSFFLLGGLCCRCCSVLFGMGYLKVQRIYACLRKDKRVKLSAVGWWDRVKVV